MEDTTTLVVKTQALNQLMTGTSILIPFAALAIKLLGWSSEDEPASKQVQCKGDGADDATQPGVSDDDFEDDIPLPGAVSTTKVTFDVSAALADAMQNQIGDVPSHITWDPISEPSRYYGEVDRDSQAGSDIIVPDDDDDDIDSLADLEPLSPQSWDFDEEEEVAEEQLWHSLDDPVVLPGLPEIVLSPPPEDEFPLFEDVDAYELDLEGCF